MQKLEKEVSKGLAAYQSGFRAQRAGRVLPFHQATTASVPGHPASTHLRDMWIRGWNAAVELEFRLSRTIARRGTSGWKHNHRALESSDLRKTGAAKR